MNNNPTIFIIDDEDAFRDGLHKLIEISGYKVESYKSAEHFLKKYKSNQCGCLILDVDMPGINGLDLQKTLVEKKIMLPIIFITGHGNIPMSVKAVKAGAVDFLEKPFKKQVLLDLIKVTFEKDKRCRDENVEHFDIIKRYHSLSTRMKEVLELVVAGFSNKEIAVKLNISHRTVDVHRSKMIKNMNANSLPELVTMAKICGIENTINASEI